MAAASISASLLLCLLRFVFAFSEDQINIKAVIGENKILPCRAENGSIRMVEWKRTGIEEGIVLRYRNDAVDRDNQHPSFKERVIFQDIEMKDGDVSLVLINVRMNDAGTYEAGVGYKETNSKGNLTCSIHLDVAPPPPESFPSWAIALLVILVLILIGFIFYCRRHPRLMSVAERLRRSEEINNSRTGDSKAGSTNLSRSGAQCRQSGALTTSRHFQWESSLLRLHVIRCEPMDGLIISSVFWP